MITATSRSSPRATESRRVRSIELPGPAGRLEALLNEGSADARFAALVCHPHPLGGGSLNNRVIYHAMKAMNAPHWGLGWPVLRFNFRGTGRSEGHHDGEAEAGDVLAAMTWLEREFGLPLVVAGFSFGAAMVLKACCGGEPLPGLRIETWGTQDLKAVAALGLPIRSGADAARARVYDYSFLAHCRIPKLFLSGDNDQFATKAELIKEIGRAHV